MRALFLAVVCLMLSTATSIADAKQDCEGLTGDAAIAACDIAIEQNPNDYVSYNNRGVEYKAKRDFDRALADYNKAIEIDPKYGLAYNNRGDVYLAKHDFDQAIADYNKALEMGETKGHYGNRGRAYLGKGQSSPFWEDHNALGNYYDAEKKYDAALVEYAKAIEINPKHPWPWLNRCVTYLIVNNLQSALSDCNKSLSLNTTAAAQNNRGLVFMKMGRLQQAVTDFDAALKYSPKLAEALYARGVARRKLGDVKRGLADIEAARALDASVAESFAIYGISP